MHEGHVLKSLGTGIRSAWDHDNSGISSTGNDLERAPEGQLPGGLCAHQLLVRGAADRCCAAARCRAAASPRSWWSSSALMLPVAVNSLTCVAGHRAGGLLLVARTEGIAAGDHDQVGVLSQQFGEILVGPAHESILPGSGEPAVLVCPLQVWVGGPWPPPAASGGLPRARAATRAHGNLPCAAPRRERAP